MIEVIEASGYGATLPAVDETAEAAERALDHAQDREYRSYRTKALISLALGAIAMLVSMPLMATGGHHGAVDPIMAWADRVIGGRWRRGFRRFMPPRPTCFAGACWA